MPQDPYRLSAAREEPPPSSRNPMDEIGPHRSTHKPRHKLWVLAPAFATMVGIFLLGAIMAAMVSLKLVAIIAPFAIAIFVMVGWTPFRDRNSWVELHRNGIVLGVGKVTTALPFDEIDEVWLKLHTVESMVGDAVLIREMWLVDIAGRRHRVPCSLERSPDVTTWILRHCSEPLLAEAASALREGRKLTFGNVVIDRDGLQHGRFHARFDELSLVRLLPGRIAFFRGQKVFPRHTIHLEDVPHPIVFAKLVMSLAKTLDGAPPTKKLAP